MRTRSLSGDSPRAPTECTVNSYKLCAFKWPKLIPIKVRKISKHLVCFYYSVNSVNRNGWRESPSVSFSLTAAASITPKMELVSVRQCVWVFFVWAYLGTILNAYIFKMNDFNFESNISPRFESSFRIHSSVRNDRIPGDASTFVIYVDSERHKLRTNMAFLRYGFSYALSTDILVRIQLDTLCIYMDVRQCVAWKWFNFQWNASVVRTIRLTSYVLSICPWLWNPDCKPNNCRAWRAHGFFCGSLDCSIYGMLQIDKNHY